MECFPRVMRILFGLFLVLSIISAAAEEALSSSDGNFFSEGGKLISGVGSVVKRKVTARKEAPSISVSTENVTEEVAPKVANISLKFETVKLSNQSTSIGDQVNDAVQHSIPAPIDGLNSRNISTITVSSDNGTTVLHPPKYSPDTSQNESTTTPPKKKAKPDLTFDIDDLPKDSNGKVIMTNENLIGSSPSFDYVVPVVISMLAIPLVAVVGAFLYKKSRDFWERRHYRRMDFLIDGMYND